MRRKRVPMSDAQCAAKLKRMRRNRRTAAALLRAATIVEQKGDSTTAQQCRDLAAEFASREESR